MTSRVVHPATASSDRDGPATGPWCPRPVRWAASLHRWEQLAFLHWSYEPDQVRRLLPSGLDVETFDGRAWVSLVPFRMSITVGSGPLRARSLPVAPWIGRFAETNVRTYVRGPDGGTGVWFLSLDAARLAAVVAGRRGFDLPYCWAAMSIGWRAAPDGRLLVDYRSRRRWPGPPAISRVTVEVGERLGADRLSVLDHWLTARWALYRSHDGVVSSMAAEHGPWPLHAARAPRPDHSLLEAAGLPAPGGDPLVHWSPGVAVRVGARGRSSKSVRGGGEVVG